MSKEIYLSPNSRLVDYLKKNQAKTEVFSMHTWINNLWDNYREKNNLKLHLISNLQQQAIFEQIIANDIKHTALIKPSNTAVSVMEAYNLSCMYTITLKDLEAALAFNENNRFIDWIKNYINYCTKYNLVDFATAIKMLIKNLKYQQTFLPLKIHLVGFDEVSLLIKQLFIKLEKLGCHIIYSNLSIAEPTTPAIKKIACINEEQEIMLAAKWAYDHITKNPTENIGIIVANLADCRKMVARIFRHFFAAVAVNIAAPVSLNTYRIIQEAFLIFDLTKYWIDLETLSQFLRANFIHVYSKEAPKRILFDLYIRELGEPKFTLSQIILQLKQYQLKNQVSLPKLTASFEQLLSFKQSLPKIANVNFWQQKITELFKNMHWPNKHHFTPNEYQLIAVWEKALQEYLSLGHILQSHSFSAAKNEIKKIAAQIPFLPSTPVSQVNVYGLTEAIGLPFDRIWLVGMHANAWPAKPAPNSFIPHSLQKKFSLPRSSANRQLELAKKILATIEKCCIKELVYSYASLIEDNMLQPSRLIANVPQIKQQEKLKILEFQPPANITALSTDNHGLPAENQEIVGGSAALATQAECPFKSFAKFRLKVKALKAGNLGLLPDIRGKILHQILANFWQEVKSLNNLLSLSSSDIETSLEKIIVEVINNWQQQLPNTLTNRFISIEKKRLQEICKHWLEVEKTRTSFVVEQIEAAIDLQIGKGKISLRLDRLDVDEQGNIIILDYKTGVAAGSLLEGVRMLAPQLPLYAIAYKDKVKGISFASLKANNLRFIGLAAEEEMLPGVKACKNWPQQLEAWQADLEDIANEFLEGDARVMPIKGPATCRSCDYAGLCRVADLS